MIVVVDIGGSNTRTAYSDDGLTLEGIRIVETEQTYERLIEHISAYTDEVIAQKGITPTMCVIGVPGTRNKEGIVLSSPFIPYIVGKDIQSDIKEKMNGVQKVVVVNDAFLVGLGERAYGAGKHEEATRCAYLTISTGVGGAFFHTDGREIAEMLEASLQYEPGRQYVGDKTLEDIIGGHAVESAMGKKPRDITDTTFWKEKAMYAARGIWNATLFWSPEIFILGGPMVVRSPGIALSDIETALQTLNASHVHVPRLLLGTLGDHGGLYGGLALSHLI